MIKKLRFRLTLLYSVIIGLILIAIIVGIALYNRLELKKNELSNFQNQLLTMTARLQSDVTIPHSWLAQIEYDNLLIIDILDNNIPFRFEGSWHTPTERKILIKRLQEKAAAENVFPDTRPISSVLIKSSIFQIDGDFGDSYYGTLVLMRTNTGHITLNMLTYIRPGHLLQRNAGIFYLFLYLSGQSVIALISWYFIGRTIKPVEHAVKKQHEFIAAASHELRSPLAVIQTGLSGIALEGENQAENKRTIETAQKECRRMARLIGDLLLLASSDAKTWPLQKEQLDMDTLLIECYEAFVPIAREKQQLLQLDLPEAMLPRIQGDWQRLEQILTILIDNALSYTPEGKLIRIHGYSRNNWVVIDIEDEGPGIADADKERIFDRFYRAEHSRNDKNHFGLGLSIARELTELHNGRLRVRDSDSGGAVFSLLLRVKTK